MCNYCRPCPQQGLYSPCGPTYIYSILPGRVVGAFLASSARSALLITTTWLPVLPGPVLLIPST
jgi:hypothetical protein